LCGLLGFAPQFSAKRFRATLVGRTHAPLKSVELPHRVISTQALIGTTVWTRATEQPPAAQ
jgi:hypothetical protein